jgi:hypothetical protein
MDVVELVVYAALAVWGPPLLFTAYLLADQISSSTIQTVSSTSRPIR